MAKIEFLLPGKEPLTFDCETLKEAVVKAVKDGADLGYADLRYANLCGADLGYANLCVANLCGADLGYANLCGANLRYANLCYADLRDANLCYADLRDANLCGADLGYANLCDANLCGANLRDANLCGALYNGRKLWSRRPVLQLGCCGSVGRQTIVFLFVGGSSPLVKCGCFSGNVDEFETKIHKTHRGTFHEAEYMAMVAHIRAIHALQKEYGEGNK